MVTSTITLEVHADSFVDMIEAAEDALVLFLEMDLDEVHKKVQYELLIERDTDVHAEYGYSGRVVAKVKQ